MDPNGPTKSCTATSSRIRTAASLIRQLLVERRIAGSNAPMELRWNGQSFFDALMNELQQIQIYSVASQGYQSFYCVPLHLHWFDPLAALVGAYVHVAMENVHRPGVVRFRYSSSS